MPNWADTPLSSICSGDAVLRATVQMTWRQFGTRLLAALLQLQISFRYQSSATFSTERLVLWQWRAAPG